MTPVACLRGSYGGWSPCNFVISPPRLITWRGEVLYKNIPSSGVKYKPLWRATNWYYGNIGRYNPRECTDWLSSLFLNSLAYHGSRKQEVYSDASTNLRSAACCHVTLSGV